MQRNEAMTIMTKALLGAGAAAAALVSTASPVMARDQYGRGDGISVGDVIAGAVVLGGIAAVASSIGNDRNRGYSYGYPSSNNGYDYRYNDRNGYNDRYDRNDYRNGNPRQAVEQCVATAESEANRYSYGRANVTDIRGVDSNSRGYTVRGRIAVNGQNGGYGGYGNGWNNNERGYDTGSFKCKVEYGRVVDIDFDGVRGLC
jgi:hypothetical protein